MSILAGDVGGTKTLLGLFDPQAPRPRPLAVRSFTTLDYADLRAMISDFSTDPTVRGVHVDVACFGIAGPVIDGSGTLTNVPWTVVAGDISSAFNIRRVRLLNDLQATAYAVQVLEPSELHVLQEGEPRGGNEALIAAGTGLGEALLHDVEGRFISSPTEAGHADFSARTESEIRLLRDLIQRFGRAEVEHVVSGPGLVNIHRTTHRVPCLVVEEDSPDAPSDITAAALARRCQGCMDALGMFVDAYGAEAGNLALRSLATAGVFIGGGIAPKILPALTDGRFIRAFFDKAPFEDMLRRIPVRVILNDQAGLLGAAVYAAGLAGGT